MSLLWAGEEWGVPEWGQFKRGLVRGCTAEPIAAFFFLINSFPLTSCLDKILIRTLKLPALTFIESSHSAFGVLRPCVGALFSPCPFEWKLIWSAWFILAGLSMTRPPPLFCFSKGGRGGGERYCGVVQWLRSAGESEWRIGVSPGLLFFPEHAFKGQIRRLTAGMTDGRLAVIWTDNGVNTWQDQGCRD